MSANEKKTSKEFKELLECLKGMRMSGEPPFARFLEVKADAARGEFNASGLVSGSED
jgi:hypothetical protein